jgi:hypothetical protein
VVLYGLVGNSKVTSSSVDPDYCRKIAIALIDRLALVVAKRKFPSRKKRPRPQVQSWDASHKS